VIFPTVEFAAFFAVVLCLSWALMPRPTLWKPFILVASYVFYGYADWRFVALLVSSTLLNQTAAIGITRSATPIGRKAWLVTAVAINLGLLGVFKYLGFFVDSVDRFLTGIGLGAPLPLLHVVLPIGISFFTFQAISYVADVHSGLIRPSRLLDFAIYEAFFPHLIAGPIVRAREFLPQLSSPRDRSAIPAGPALFLIVGGLIKKVVIADLLATRLVDPVFDAPRAHSGQESLAAIYGYAVQIYCDFSAYTDMAIGLALLLGFRFPQNFNRPYTADSLQDFWRRWHMTLSRWLRDYVYVPLGGNRGSRLKTYRNIMITMLLGGLWHGASWSFVVWGGMHGTGLVYERWRRDRGVRRRSGHAPPDDAPVLVGAGVAHSGSPPVATGVLLAAAHTRTRGLRHRSRDVAPWEIDEPAPRPSRASQALRCMATFQFVCLAWVFFRARSVEDALTVLSRIAHPGPSPLVTVPVLAAIAAGLATQVIPSSFWESIQGRFSALPLVLQGVAFGAVLVLVTSLVADQGVAPFLYFRF
jgi:D-alanyl-lipoteichoic acid acyltransferase DltB (MBOAT superfamily)